MQPTEQDIAELYDRYAHVVYLRAFRITGNEELANDAVQETFARVIRSWETFRGESSPLTWMVRISTNWCLNQIRNKRGRSDKLNHHRHDIVGDGVDELVFNEDADRIRRLLSEADEETRRIVVHIFFDDMTREETAAMVGLSVPTVRKRLRRFISRSRQTLGVPAAALIFFLVAAL
ncbi:MAG: RNA polymerase sigma-70 factor (ECF subfamily) [Myxococcota bacterium]|jgi:RNA polymerase sigma-70 factor (ECF subfamily)